MASSNGDAKIGGSGVRGVVFHHHQAAGWEIARAGPDAVRSRVRCEGRTSATQSTASLGDAGQAQSRFDGFVGKLARFVPARDFLLFHRRRELAVLQHRAGRVVEQAAESENDHFDFFSILAQVSRSATVRLKTGFSGVLSGSTEK